MEIKGFITNLGKYNEGELIGEWITFPIDEDELNDVFKRIGLSHYDEEMEYINTGYEEYFFTDWETFFVNDFEEFENIDEMNELAENLQYWDEDTYSAACEIWGKKDINIDKPDNYILYPNIETEEDLGYYWIEESGCYDSEDLGDLRNYIDYEKFGRDIALEIDGGFTRYGFIEYIG